jgi:MinD superfamily P-loop ATPase containing an inserted ferredoxin domain
MRCGLALDKLKSHQSLDRSHRVTPALISPEACTSCGRCVIACRDGGYHVLSLHKGTLVIDTSRCDGCSFAIMYALSGAIVLTEGVQDGKAHTRC